MCMRRGVHVLSLSVVICWSLWCEIRWKQQQRVVGVDMMRITIKIGGVLYMGHLTHTPLLWRLYEYKSSLEIWANTCPLSRYGQIRVLSYGRGVWGREVPPFSGHTDSQTAPHPVTQRDESPQSGLHTPCADSRPRSSGLHPGYEQAS